MSKKSSNTTSPAQYPVQSVNWELVLEAQYKDGTPYSIDHLKTILCKYSQIDNFRYWAILHNKDVDENGLFKRNHYHIIVRMPKRYTMNPILKHFSFIFDVEENMLGVEKVCSLNSMLRYLVHRDEIDDSKYRYAPSCVFSNDIETFNTAFLAGGVNEIMTDTIVKAVADYGSNIVDLVRCLGAETYVKYRWLIQDLLRASLGSHIG